MALALAILGARGELLEVRKIWDAAPHNAFTDLVKHRGLWWCAFREGAAHVSPDGAIRVLVSGDGARWESAALLRSEAGDLRDAKLSVTPSGELMLVAAAALKPGGPARHQTFAWFSNDGREWGDPLAIGEPDYWLWRVVWGEGTAWGIGYDTTGQRRDTRLYRSADGRTFERVTNWVSPGPSANETGLLVEKAGKLTILARRDGEPISALLVRGEPPYKAWQVINLGARVGGPALMRLPDGRLLGAGRLHDGKTRTALFWVKEDGIVEFQALPSGGDSSYPGLVYENGVLWVSYYSSHEGKTSIYLAKVRLE
ncbi:MAG: exo-alpha-sialidase [Acidobacteria bacterium]|nr:exo-alpha-sialidase [Acidobacteriota bacterium]